MKGLTGCKNYFCNFVLVCPYAFKCKDIKNPFFCSLDNSPHTCSSCEHWLKDCRPSMFEEAEKEKNQTF